MNMEYSKTRTANPKNPLARRPVKPCVGAPYFVLIACGYAALATGLSLLAKAPSGSLEPLSAWDRVEAQPLLLRGFFLLSAMALVSIMVDFTGRFGASLIFDLRHVERVSARRWALFRLVVLTAILLSAGLFASIAPGMLPPLQGWMKLALPIALLVPVGLAAFEWRRASQGSLAWQSLY